MKNPRDILEEYAYSEDSRNDKPKYSIDSALAQLEEYYKPLEPIDEKELDKVLFEAGVAGNTTRRCLVLAIMGKFGSPTKKEE